MPVPISATRIALALGLAAALALSLTSASRAGDPSLYANYVANCSFSFVGDSGAPVTSVAPGTYQVVVFTPFAFGNGTASCEFVQFHLTGPGVNLETDLGGGDVEYEQHTVTLQPSSTYTVRDDGRPTQTQRTFTVATSGSSTPSASSSSSTPTSTSKATPSKSVVGSALKPYALRGKLTATVSATGKLNLATKGKAVDALKEGRYTTTLTDESTSAGLVLQLLGKNGRATKSIGLSGIRFVGKGTTTVTLQKGQWVFRASGSGRKTYFLVTA